ncbi:threonine ammonia-lyase [Listeria monocytogenes]|uniref:L-threonine dehydratase n=2 Tax=Listeria monocytogenes TaxID=1639 RepID=A0A393SL50_LISMN|nr:MULTISPECIES: threonine ammonia-lyase [Listeria]EAE1680813.1 threonine ammonia-lyase [Listeria monocytogenes LIS0071]EAE3706058.1 threonine ammonia-lyase [Listeria monocytogenes serotype 1/2b]EAF4527953.1 threonine ammonia-lyase [Listeria monocytogenes serotype 1/2a]EAG6252815.1 threonine ammonia-lyase [Listeria monocytogenes CFSAN003806]EAG6262188.1 threonine ammonia-lyase [Listeria monocytogenes CFSAN003725]EAG6332173.1 threonine ammonia-lyase [Listeria monocytogenes CFSAN002346]EAG6349
MELVDLLVTEEDVEKAYEVLKAVVKHTPLEYDFYLSEKYHCNVYLKREDLQRVRSFKLRGAFYAISRLSAEQLEKGVVCASAGNHAQGVAYTCKRMTVPATIFMPTTTPQQKVSQVKFFGGSNVEVVLVGDTFDASATAAKEFAATHGQTFIPPFDDPDIIAGQGSLAVEMVKDLNKAHEQADYVFAGIGGGGLISGVATYLKAKSPITKIIGVEPDGAPSMTAALKQNQVVTLDKIDKFVDGAAVKEVGGLTFQHAKVLVDEVTTVSEGAVCSTILDMYTKQAIVAEPAGALSVAALEIYREEIKDKTVVCIVSGGNNDINRMQEIEERSLLHEGLKHYFIVNFSQRPGALKEFVNDVLGPHDDITKFEYTKKVNRGNGPVIIGVLLQDKNDYEGLLERVAAFDPSYIPINDNQTLYTLLV